MQQNSAPSCKPSDVVSAMTLLDLPSARSSTRVVLSESKNDIDYVLVLNVDFVPELIYKSVGTLRSGICDIVDRFTRHGVDIIISSSHLFHAFVFGLHATCSCSRPTILHLLVYLNRIHASIREPESLMQRLCELGVFHPGHEHSMPSPVDVIVYRYYSLATESLLLAICNPSLSTSVLTRHALQMLNYAFRYVLVETYHSLHVTEPVTPVLRWETTELARLLHIDPVYVPATKQVADVVQTEQLMEMYSQLLGLLNAVRMGIVI